MSFETKNIVGKQCVRAVTTVGKKKRSPIAQKILAARDNKEFGTQNF